MQPKVLVGCPTYSGMEYCLDKYAKTVKSLTHPNYDILLVDNSKDNSYNLRIHALNLKGQVYLNGNSTTITSSATAPLYAVIGAWLKI